MACSMPAAPARSRPALASPLAARLRLPRRPRYEAAMLVPVPPPVPSPVPQAEAPRDCPLCPRLVALREECRAEHPGWWNAPVPAWGDPAAWLAVVGMAPGKHGANRTGRPFTGDFAG